MRKIVNTTGLFFRAAALFLSFSLLLGNASYALGPVAGGAGPNTGLVDLSNKYSYPVLKGVRFDPKNPLNLKFLVDSADQAKVSREDADILIKYFLAGLALPEDDMWVNLSPYEAQRVLPQSLALTDMGKGMLSQDYFLKRLSSSLTYPESESGRQYWHDAKTVNNNFNKVWISPDKVTVYEKDNTAVISAASLKVTAEDGCLESFKTNILPLIAQDVNKGSNFAQLRQIYHSLILAVWFKQKFKESFYKNYIGHKKLSGVNTEDKKFKEKIYREYVESFQKGAYDYLKTQRIGSKIVKRRYFSGGVALQNLARFIERTSVVPDEESMIGMGQVVDAQLHAITDERLAKIYEEYADNVIAIDKIETKIIDSVITKLKKSGPRGSSLADRLDALRAIANDVDGQWRYKIGINLVAGAIHSHAGGRGINIAYRDGMTIEDITNEIIHEVIAGNIFGDGAKVHALAQDITAALARDDTQTAAGLLNDLDQGLTFEEKALWDMVDGERGQVGRDYASSKPSKISKETAKALSVLSKTQRGVLSRRKDGVSGFEKNRKYLKGVMKLTPSEACKKQVVELVYDMWLGEGNFSLDGAEKIIESLTEEGIRFAKLNFVDKVRLIDLVRNIFAANKFKAWDTNWREMRGALPVSLRDQSILIDTAIAAYNSAKRKPKIKPMPKPKAKPRPKPAAVQPVLPPVAVPVSPTRRVVPVRVAPAARETVPKLRRGAIGLIKSLDVEKSTELLEDRMLAQAFIEAYDWFAKSFSLKLDDDDRRVVLNAVYDMIKANPEQGLAQAKEAFVTVQADDFLAFEVEKLSAQTQLQLIRLMAYVGQYGRAQAWQDTLTDYKELFGLGPLKGFPEDDRYGVGMALARITHNRKESRKARLFLNLSAAYLGIDADDFAASSDISLPQRVDIVKSLGSDTFGKLSVRDFKDVLNYLAQLGFDAQRLALVPMVDRLYLLRAAAEFSVNNDHQKLAAHLTADTLSRARDLEYPVLVRAMSAFIRSLNRDGNAPDFIALAQGFRPADPKAAIAELDHTTIDGALRLAGLLSPDRVAELNKYPKQALFFASTFTLLREGFHGNMRLVQEREQLLDMAYKISLLPKPGEYLEEIKTVLQELTDIMGLDFASMPHETKTPLMAMAYDIARDKQSQATFAWMQGLTALQERFQLGPWKELSSENRQRIALIAARTVLNETHHTPKAALDVLTHNFAIDYKHLTGERVDVMEMVSDMALNRDLFNAARNIAGVLDELGVTKEALAGQVTCTEKLRLIRTAAVASSDARHRVIAAVGEMKEKDPDGIVKKLIEFLEDPEKLPLPKTDKGRDEFNILPPQSAGQQYVSEFNALKVAQNFFKGLPRDVVAKTILQVLGKDSGEAEKLAIYDLAYNKSNEDGHVLTLQVIFGDGVYEVYLSLRNVDGAISPDLLLLFDGKEQGFDKPFADKEGKHWVVRGFSADQNDPTLNVPVLPRAGEIVFSRDNRGDAYFVKTFKGLPPLAQEKAIEKLLQLEAEGSSAKTVSLTTSKGVKVLNFRNASTEYRILYGFSGKYIFVDDICMIQNDKTLTSAGTITKQRLEAFKAARQPGPQAMKNKRPVRYGASADEIVRIESVPSVRRPRDDDQKSLGGVDFKRGAFNIETNSIPIQASSVELGSDICGLGLVVLDIQKSSLREFTQGPL